VAETLDWARALVALDASTLDDDVAADTLGCFLKDEADIRLLRGELASRGTAALVAEGIGLG
jgi:hypothetical protein